LRATIDHQAQALRACPNGAGLSGTKPLELLDALLACAGALQAQALRLHDGPVPASIRARMDGQEVALADCPPALLRQLQDELLRRMGAVRGAADLPRGEVHFDWPEVDRPDVDWLNADGPDAATPRHAPAPAALALRIGLRACPVGAGRLALLLTLRPQRAAIPALDALGLAQHDAQSLCRILRQPQGLVVLTGPRRAGLTTTAYAMLDALEGVSGAGRCVQAIEAAPARPTPHWLQCVPAAPGVAGVDAARLRSLAPDVLFLDVLPFNAPTADFMRQALVAVGEGVLVLLALRGERAQHVFASLRTLGVPPADLAPHLSGVLAQRLVRRLCPHCAQPDDSAELRGVLARAANSWLREGTPRGARADPSGCAHCGGRGTRGHALLYEWLEVDAGVRAMIEEGIVGQELEQRMLADGRAIWDQGIRLLARGEVALAALREALREP
jgi:hypothetical protein